MLRGRMCVARCSGLCGVFDMLNVKVYGQKEKPLRTAVSALQGMCIFICASVAVCAALCGAVF